MDAVEEFEYDYQCPKCKTKQDGTVLDICEDWLPERLQGKYCGVCFMELLSKSIPKLVELNK